MVPDYYEILGVSRSATDDEIKSAFRVRAKATHPDTASGATGTSDTFREVKLAYDVLIDPERRSEYNSSLPNLEIVKINNTHENVDSSYDQKWENNYIYKKNVKHSKLSTYELNFLYISKEVIAKQSEREKFEFECDYVCYPSLEQIYNGFEIIHYVNTETDCPKCSSSGIFLGRGPACNECRGVGHAGNRSFVGRLLFGDPCSECDGLGYVRIPETCGECHGSGKLSKSRQETIIVPPGIPDKSVVYGKKHSLKTLIVTMKHAKYERRGHDIVTMKHLKEGALKKGTSITVYDLRGVRHVIRIPPNSCIGAEFRIKRKGLPKINESEIGDLVIVIW